LPCQQNCPPGAASLAKPEKKESLLGTGSPSMRALLPANCFRLSLSLQHSATEDAADRSTTDALDPSSSSLVSEPYPEIAAKICSDLGEEQLINSCSSRIL